MANDRSNLFWIKAINVYWANLISVFFQFNFNIVIKNRKTEANFHTSYTFDESFEINIRLKANIQSRAKLFAK